LNILKLIDKGALFIINHSGGKDSQAMTAYLKKIVPNEQLIVIHAHLPQVEWEGTIEHIENTIGDLEFHIVQAQKTFFEMVRHRGKFPDANNRQCTSDLKRGPIEKKIRELAKYKNKRLVINCMGIRAEESPGRAKKKQFTFNQNQSKAGRKWYNWYPIFNWHLNDVLEVIAISGQQLHWAYQKGMTRLSCCFCILASKADLKTAAICNPELYRNFVALEKELDFTMIMPKKKEARKFLEEITEVAA